MASPSPQPRLLPISWKFLKEKARAETSLRGSTRSPSPEQSMSKQALALVGATKARDRLYRLLGRAAPLVLPHPNTKPRRQDAVAAAQHSFQRRLSYARNVYDRLHTSTDLPYLSNTAALRSLPITTLYKRHLATQHKRLPTALKATCDSA